MTIKAAVVGTGFIGPAHVEALRRLGIEVTGICGSSPERARPRAEALNLPVYNTYEELLADRAVDVVHITTPNVHHHPQALAAIEAGKHVVCEKPLAMNAGESAELLALARQRGIVHAVNFNIRFYPLVQQARAIVRSGELGEVRIIHGSYLQDWLFLESDWNWRLVPELGGELRAVGDIGSHWLDLMTFITGHHVERVMADFATFIPIRKKPAKPIDTFVGKTLRPEDYTEEPIHTEDYATVLLHFEGGARGVMTVSQVSSGRKNRLWFEINGSRSSLAWDSEQPNMLWIGHRECPNEVLIKDPALEAPEARRFTGYPGGHAEGFPDTFKMLYQAIYAHIADRSVPIDFPTFDDGHEEMVIGEAILKSARESQWANVAR
jgi:predicted dehydrogenase